MSTNLHYLEILEKLISFNSISSESNLPLIEYIACLLHKHQFSVKRFYNREKTKANLIATIGPSVGGGLMLAGHTDVVPVQGQAWLSDPFKLTLDKDRLIGRGTSDMKGFIALICDVATRGVHLKQLKKPIYLVFTYDEEIGCFGAKALTKQLRKLAPQIDFALIGEPTNFALVNTHKALQAATTHIRGKAAHSSCPHLGRNAIMAGAKLLTHMEAMLPTERDRNFSPPTATLNVGKILGGNAVNIIAEHCQFDWECRPLPSQDIHQINSTFSTMAAAIAETDEVEINTTIKALVPGLTTQNNRACVEFLKQFLPKDTQLNSAPFVTEAGLFEQANIPTVLFGPGELEQAHQPNESISRQAMECYEAFLLSLIAHYCN